ncbi:MAG: hypothetical protein IPF53_12785 [Blastocatellia bacterium]|nr:hypothetical protein [Blastocatellia bacterium]MBK6426845.1 hypothetical protein [Blastocatellia bacterium]
MSIDDRLDPERPLATFVTFRSYGTWLHGDERGSVSRFTNVVGKPRIAPNARRCAFSNARLQRPPVRLNAEQRLATSLAIRETCEIRGWSLIAENVRTNHVHVVVSADEEPKRIAAVLKANATRVMRLAGCWREVDSPWARGSSGRKVFSESGLGRVVRYVVEGQGKSLEDLD